jgi:hypothetical protein
MDAYLISEPNQSYAWGRALWYIVKTPGLSHVSPLILTVTEFGPDGLPLEDADITAQLDQFLQQKDEWSVEIVAFTIFPQRYLQIANGDRHAFYEICHDTLPYLKAKNPHLNGRGMYFERLMKFGRGRVNENQLEFILTEYLEGRHRSSKYQAVIFDPERDQTPQPYQTFPCLQTVTFVPTDDGLVVNAVYALQYLVRRGYGNLLGLAQLGAFMAREMKLPLARLNIVAGVEKLDFSKAAVKPILDVIQNKVPNLHPPAQAAAA